MDSKKYDYIVAELIQKLDYIARDYDPYAYGLPCHHQESLSKMKVAVIDAINEISLL
jgi:hypothetical protein